MIDKQIMKLPGIKRIQIMLAGFAALQALFIIGQAWTLSAVITSLWDGKNLSNQISKLVLFTLAYCARHLINYFRDRILDKYSYEQARDLREQLLQKVFRLGPQIVQTTGTGNTTTMALDGISQVENYINLIFTKTFNMSVIPIIILIAVYFLDIESGIVLTLVFPLIIIFMIILGYAAQSKADKQYKTFQILSNHFIDSLRGIDTLKYFGLTKKYENSIFSSSERFRKATMNTLRIAILSTFALDFFTTISIAIVAVLLGLRLIDHGITLFPALTVLILSPEYFLPIRDFSSDYHATLDGKNAFEAIKNVLSTPEVAHPAITIPEWDNTSKLEVQNLSFNYDDQPTLSKLNFSATGFQKIGIIGMSGSGKSTLINLLNGFLEPLSGSIKVNDVALPSFNQKDWQQQLIYIPQNPYIFQLSLRENIAFYNPNSSDKEILKAIETVGLNELLAELPEGLDTQLGEAARSISGGQAQRVALARAFLNPKRHILLFDEPTAHLDIETEIELKERMLPIMDNHLVFFATHRLHWMKNMDYILVLDHGKLVEHGTYDTLAHSNGAFTRLVNGLKGGTSNVE
ncbi:thiol reductant ABC exporter subunit CydD [Pediococcus claussenii]|uniref:Thiol reductant ABC exporter, CydD subunit n=1 Tax=Pediococcus claussenii (strain ATCC BAA-344 / DSM 14800 / JCM 18046 / KCTC 3811 / LMG 21948 / P06) TaxID=701521 RepID=G8PAS9_PEDCP|nr:thiol reductant ABC exporter subunit CydD [Pediococcus claussenii]AEV94638.1 thiol reductant ABC exporter, CydD subunit [Pediococcus claussenii ATCC BAA-344]ANZ69841.1 thiol reductant ABC exporter subunit CydD [Pediococcus claussenii]ANZ71658.1 thiol reductant ABC exporter subunit CydD [Pediococcus claussenii]KRN20818.1 cydD protein [Pediococcus claussenii]